MNNNPNDWRHNLPVNRVEFWIERIWITIGTMALGALILFLYLQFRTNNNFQGGAEWMQKAYTTPGMVERIVVKKGKDRDYE